MSNPDSFIEEVTEEVRRDRLFAAFRKYGWIGGLVVLGIVGGAAWNEWQKNQAAARAQGAAHVLVARGRDYKDVSPLRGVYAGASASGVFVKVEITKEA